MESIGGGRGLAEEIELCGKLRNDIGNLLKYNVKKAAKVQTEIDEHKAVAVLIDKEVSHLEANLCSAESSLQDASGCLEKLEVAAAHMKETTRVLGDQLNLSLQQIESSTEAFEELRKRHVSFCKVQDETHRKMASVESLIRSIVNEDAQMRGYAVEISQLKQSISDIEEKKAALLPVLESCKNGLEVAAAEYNRRRRDNACHLEVIESCRIEEGKLRNQLEILEREHKELCAQEAALENGIAQGKAERNAAVQTVRGKQEEALLEQASLLKGIDQQQQEKRHLEQEQETLKQEMAEATKEMYQTMGKMNELRQRDAVLAKNKALLVQQLKSEKEAIIQLKTEEHKICDLLTAQQKAALLAEALRRGEARLNELTVMKESALMEKNEMNALLEQENAILSERLGALECAEEEVNEAIGQGQELEGLIARLDTLYNEQKDVTQRLMISRKQVDIQLEEVDRAESRLKQLLQEKAQVDHENKLQKEHIAQEEILHKQLREEVSMFDDELTNVKQQKQDIQTKFDDGEGTAKHTDGRETANKNETEVARLHGELQQKYQDACAQIRMEYRQQYTGMLEQTLKDEEVRLAAEKRKREAEITQQIEHLKNVHQENQAKIFSLQPPEHQGPS